MEFDSEAPDDGLEDGNEDEEREDVECSDGDWGDDCSEEVVEHRFERLSCTGHGQSSDCEDDDANRVDDERANRDK